MDLTPYVDALRDQLATAAEAGGDDARAVAERLVAPLESGMRLALLDALSAAADEITRDLAPGSVDVRLRGREPSFVVTVPPADEAPQAPADAAPPMPDGDEGTMTRINLRLSENLKSRIEDAAAGAGLSVNAWIVRAAGAALGSDGQARRTESRSARSANRFTGWVR
ncbi:MAG TPA: toxin-antitoxin system HicB family antitoxin [Pseudonocardiaceae bacterium]|jgi:hypothetical protein|nr:toxin-antitoxin system HicB family antitoxin [Pseudonocardiaceae bacterium]